MVETSLLMDIRGKVNLVANQILVIFAVIVAVHSWF